MVPLLPIFAIVGTCVAIKKTYSAHFSDSALAMKKLHHWAPRAKSFLELNDHITADKFHTVAEGLVLAARKHYSQWVRDPLTDEQKEIFAIVLVSKLEELFEIDGKTPSDQYKRKAARFYTPHTVEHNEAALFALIEKEFKEEN